MNTSQEKQLGVLFLTNGYPDHPGSFRGHFIQRMAAGIQNRGYRIAVVTPRVFQTSPLFETDPFGIPIRRFPYPSGNRQLIQTPKTPLAGLVVYLASGLCTALRAARKTPVHLVHVHWVIPIGLIGLALRRILKVKLIVHAWGSDIHTYAVKNPLFSGLTRLILREADALIGVSDDLACRMRLLEPHTTDIHIIQSAVDTDKFHPGNQAEARKALDLPQDARILLFVGGLIPIKGIPLLQKAMEPVIRDNPRCRLLVAGDGPLREEMELWSREHGQGRVSLLGSVAPNDMPEFYRAADAFVLPSLNEGTPYSLLEAMSSGLPSVTFPVGGIPAIVTHGDNGLLPEKGSVEDLSRWIGYLMRDSESARAMGGRARDSVLGFGEQQSYARITDIYDSLVKSSSDRSLFSRPSI